MTERLLFTILIVLAGYLVYAVAHRRNLRRINQSVPISGSSQPTLLYFRSDGCPACPTQARYLEQLVAAWHDRLSVQQIDADAEPETAARYGVFTLPTTIVVDARGAVREVNYGVANSYKLAKQLEAIA
jgi:thioredoxin 1